MKHKDDNQVTGDDEHSEKEDDNDFQQARVEDLRVTNVQKAEGHGALVQLSCVHLVQGLCGHTKMEEGFLGVGWGVLTQQILPRLLLAPADGTDVTVPDVCHLSRNRSRSFPQSMRILLYTQVYMKSTADPNRDHTGRTSTTPTLNLHFLCPVPAFSRRGTAVKEQDRPMPESKWINKRKSLPL